MARDWVAWHDEYAEPGSNLARRLEVVRAAISRALDEWPGQPVRVLSLCAGRGDDLLYVLAHRDDADRVTGRLVELDSDNVAVAREHAAATGLTGIEIVEADAGDTSQFADVVPADLVLLCGIFGNIPDDDVFSTVAAAPQLCNPGATLLWTRGRWEPDLTPAIRQAFTGAGFTELGFTAPDDAKFSVGVCRYDGSPVPLAPAHLFTFN